METFKTLYGNQEHSGSKIEMSDENHFENGFANKCIKACTS